MEDKPERRKIGEVEKAVRKDLRAVSVPPGRAVLAQNALLLARALDGRDAASAGVAATAQLTRELRATMIALTGGIDDDDKAAALRAFVESLSAPVGDPETARPPHVGTTGGGHLRSVGEAVHAPSAAHRRRRAGG